MQEPLSEHLARIDMVFDELEAEGHRLITMASQKGREAKYRGVQGDRETFVRV